jgi:hypothetical protein
MVISLMQAANSVELLTWIEEAWLFRVFHIRCAKLQDVNLNLVYNIVMITETKKGARYHN